MRANRITMTYQLAMAAGTDAANRRMRAAGRTKWNRADYSEAARTFNRLWPPDVDVRVITSLSPVAQALMERHEAKLR